MKKIVVPIFQFRHKPLRHDAAFTQKLCHTFTGFVPSIVVVKAQINDLRIRFQHLHHRNRRRAAAGHIAVLLPLLRVHGDIREHINGSLEHIKASVRAGMMKAVTWGDNQVYRQSDSNLEFADKKFAADGATDNITYSS